MRRNFKGGNIVNGTEQHIVRLDFELANVASQKHDTAEGRLFFELVEGASCPNGSFGKGTFVLADRIADHGISIQPLPAKLTVGFQVATSLEKLATIVGAVPYVRPRIVARVRESFDRYGKGYYSTKVELVDGENESYIYVRSSSEILPMTPFEVVFTDTKGQTITVKPTQDVPDTTEELASWADFARYVLDTGLTKAQSCPIISATALVIGVSGLTKINRDGKYWDIVSIDGQEEGTIARIHLVSGIEDGSVPLLADKPLAVKIKWMGGTIFEVTPLPEGQRVANVLRNWEDVPALLGVEINQSRKPQTAPESDSGIRVVHTEQ